VHGIHELIPANNSGQGRTENNAVVSAYPGLCPLTSKDFVWALTIRRVRNMFFASSELILRQAETLFKQATLSVQLVK
jgi:hypothetical protein